MAVSDWRELLASRSPWRCASPATRSTPKPLSALVSFYFILLSLFAITFVLLLCLVTTHIVAKSTLKPLSALVSFYFNFIISNNFFFSFLFFTFMISYYSTGSQINAKNCSQRWYLVCFMVLPNCTAIVCFSVVSAVYIWSLLIFWVMLINFFSKYLLHFLRLYSF